MIVEHADGEWLIRFGRYELFRGFWLLKMIHRWWWPKWGWWESSAASRNYEWLGWTFRIYRRREVWDLLNRRFNRLLDTRP
jgi:hypothetical protein